MKLLFYKPSDMGFQLTLTECLGFNEANCEITKQHLRLVESTYIARGTDWPFYFGRHLDLCPNWCLQQYCSTDLNSILLCILFEEDPWAYRASCIEDMYILSAVHIMYCIYLLCSWYPHCAWMCLVPFRVAWPYRASACVLVEAADLDAELQCPLQFLRLWLPWSFRSTLRLLDKVPRQS